MSTLGVVALCVSVVGYLWAARYVFREAIDAEGADWFEVCAVGVLALASAAFFPLIALYVIARATIGKRSPQRFVRVVAGESRAAKLERREREVSERESRIAQLEREVGLGR